MKIDAISFLPLSIFHFCIFLLNYNLGTERFVTSVNNKKSESDYYLIYCRFVTTLGENGYYFILPSVHFPFRIFPFHCNFISEKFAKSVNNKNLNMCTYICSDR